MKTSELGLRQMSTGPGVERVKEVVLAAGGVELLLKKWKGIWVDIFVPGVEEMKGNVR